MNMSTCCYPAPNERLSTPQPLSWDGWRQVLLLAPHADDETIGCGGLVAALADAKIPLHAVLVTDSSGAGGLPIGAAAARAQEFTQALSLLHPDATHEKWQLPDGGLSDHAEALGQKIATLLSAHPAEVLLCPWPMDMHPDHSALGYAAVNQLSSQSSHIKTVCFYEVWSPVPASHILDISSWWKKKNEALNCHKTALTCGHYSRAMQGLAAYRALLTHHMARESSFAEAFCLWHPNRLITSMTPTSQHLE